MAQKVKEKHGILNKPLPEILDDIEAAARDFGKAVDKSRTTG
jgi:hypothetical protein